MNYERSARLFSEAGNYLVGGVNSPARAMNSVGGSPLFIEKGEGAGIYDVDGNRFIDYVGSYGPLILGHNHPEVAGKVKEYLEKGTTFGAPTEIEVKTGELVSEAFPSIDLVRFVNSGTEAVMSVLRLARAVTGRKKIIKMAGCYHGHVDSLLVRSGSGVATQGLPGSEGVAESTVKDTLAANFNDIESVKQYYNEFPGEIAAVILEPVAGNMGVVKPREAYLKALRELTSDNNSLLIFDEVMTGFRYHYGGAQEVYEIEPDLTCLGKVIGGGFPVGAYGGKKRYMEKVSPLGPVYQAGTLSGNPVAMAAGYATIKVLQERPELYHSLNENTRILAEGIRSAGNETGIDLKVEVFGSMINPFFTGNEIRNFEDVSKCDTKKFSRFFWKLLDNGVYIPPSQFESWFVSAAHTREDIQKTLEGIKNALKAIS